MSERYTWKQTFGTVAEKFFDFMNVLAVCLTIIAFVAIIAYAALRRQPAFARQESRLARQLEVVMTKAGAAGSLDASQRLELAKSLIEKYDPATDSLTPQLNPDYKPLTLDEILDKGQVSQKDREELKNSRPPAESDKRW